MFLLFISAIIGYLIGSIPSGYLLAKLFKTDITKVGSGNIGATNVTRVLGAKLGGIVFVLDLLKGFLPIFILYSFAKISDPIYIMFMGISIVAGHTFSIFLKFNGGKGSATGLGVLLAATPDVFIFVFLFGILTIIITRYVSVGSILGASLAILFMFLFQKQTPYVFLALVLFLLSIFKHQSNIERLLKGCENKIGEKII